MDVHEIEILDSKLIKQLFKAWNEEFPESMAFESLKDFKVFLGKMENARHFVTFRRNNKDISAWMALYNKNNERWIVLLLPTFQIENTLATELLRMSKELENELNVWVIDHLKPQTNRVQFFLDNGFDYAEKVRFENETATVVKMRWTKSS